MLAIQKERLASDLNAIARVGFTAQGMNRVAFSVAELRARQVLIHMIQKSQLGLRIDGFGNIFGQIEGYDRDAPEVMLGSHLDSVPHGGRFDGAVGVIAALEVVRTIKESGVRHQHPIELVMFVAEEASRFGIATIGSRVITGQIDPKVLMSLTDSTKTTLGSMLTRMGIDAESIHRARRDPGTIKAYLELHIEQGQVLESMGVKIGVVTAIAAPTRLRVEFIGQADHSGATPMNLRRDALVAGAHLVCFIDELARSKRHTVATVGMIQIRPGVINVVPGEVRLGVDVRSISSEEKQTTAEEILAEARRIAERRGMQVHLAITDSSEPVMMDAEIIKLICDICEAHSISYMTMPSGAGHDAMRMASITRAGMVFVPSHAGVSHSPDEWTDISDIALGAQVLLEAALSLAS
ncbi:MAG: Zn-dependent hydrolase [Chloroflexi bacterium]|nr:Zn-dependent hydrolase [Chloroflexota bacterium]